MPVQNCGVIFSLSLAHIYSGAFREREERRAGGKEVRREKAKLWSWCVGSA